MHALRDVKKIISNQCDHFYEYLAEYVASLNLRNVVCARNGYVCNANRVAYWSHLTHPLTRRPDSSYTRSMGFMTGDEAGQDKRLTLFLAWNCVVIYVLCEALHCHAGKCQVGYFALND